MSSEDKLEEQIVAKGLNAPRLTPDSIDSKIRDVYWHVVPNSTTTLCSILLENGFRVNGESAAVSLENFDEDIGKQVAYENARTKIWALEGYLLKDSLSKLV